VHQPRVRPSKKLPPGRYRGSEGRSLREGFALRSFNGSHCPKSPLCPGPGDRKDAAQRPANLVEGHDAAQDPLAINGDDRAKPAELLE
jgi:hypothetical protein